MGKKFYVVWKGRKTGVFDDWSDAWEQVKDFPGARYKGFASSAEAAKAFRGEGAPEDSRDLAGMLAAAGSHRLPAAGQPDYMTIPEIDLDGWAVDASCMGNPGVMEYRGVELMSGRVLFRVGPFKDATNNIGEFLAIVHALALMKRDGRWHTLYSDSITAMSWVRNRQVKTKLKPTEANAKVFELLARGLAWIRTNTWSCRILKWQTELWGETPADFGRK